MIQTAWNYPPYIGIWLSFTPIRFKIGARMIRHETCAENPQNSVKLCVLTHDQFLYQKKKKTHDQFDSGPNLIGVKSKASANTRWILIFSDLEFISENKKGLNICNICTYAFFDISIYCVCNTWIK